MVSPDMIVNSGKFLSFNLADHFHNYLVYLNKQWKFLYFQVRKGNEIKSIIDISDRTSFRKEAGNLK